jgi:hypothetical protein
MEHAFYIAAFAVDGELEGVARSETLKLSDKWLRICDEFLAANGTLIDAHWSGPLSHIRTKLTTASGVALVTFSAHDKIACSISLATGLLPDSESSVLQMFVQSLRQTGPARVAAKASSESFAKVREIAERPAMFVVPWGNRDISEQDQALIRELSIHLAAAFFLREHAKSKLTGR